MYRRGEELDRSRGDELRRGQARDMPAQRVGQTGIDPRRQQGREVERGEDGQAVAQREEHVAGQRDGTRHGAGRAKHADKDLVLVDAEPDVCGGRGGEFGGPRGDAGGGPVGDGGGECVEGVCGHVGAGVEGEDEGAGLGEEEGLGAEEKGAERGADGV